MFRQVAANFLLILFTLTAIVWLAVALRRLDLLTSKGQGVFLFLQMTVLVLPNVMAMIAPVALLLACLYVLDRFNGDSELIIMTASGAPVWRFATPLLALASIIVAVLVVVNLYIMPLSMRSLRSFANEVRTDLVSQVLKPGRFTSPERGLTFHIRDRSLEGDLLGLVIHDERAKGRAMTYLAKTGHIVKTESGSFLVMRDGQIHRRIDAAADDPKAAKDPKKDQRDVSIGEFREYIFDITQFGAKSGAKELKPRERYLSELLNPKPDDALYKRIPGNFRSELHERFASLLYPFVFVLITLSFLGHARTIRENRWKSIVLAFALAVGVRIAGFAATNLLTLQAWAVVLVYGIPTGAILVAALAAQVRMAPYARIRLGWELPAKFRFYNNNFGAVLGVKTKQQRGRVA